MRTQLFTRLYLINTNPTLEVSQPVAMAGCNAVRVDSVIFALTATNVSYQVQTSNDLENWTDAGSAETQTQPGYKMLVAITGIAGAYARLKATLNGTGYAIVSAGLNGSQQS